MAGVNGFLTCFWVKEVDDGQEYCIEDSPDDPKLPPKILDSDGGNLHNDKVGDP